MVACGTDSPNPGPLPDSPARTFDAPVATADSPTATPDAAPAALPDSGVGAAGTVAIHTVAAYDPATNSTVGGRFGNPTVSFTPPTGTIESVNIPNGIGPCSANSYDVASLPSEIDGGNATFTLKHTGSGDVTLTCSFNGTTKVYDCAPNPTGFDIVDGDTVHVDYAGGNGFNAYSHDFVAGRNLTLTTATQNLLKTPLDLSGGSDLTFAMNETVDATTGLAFVVAIDATNATNAGAQDLGTNATKTANLTCAAVFSGSMTIPKAMVKVLGDIQPTKIRISLFHDQSDVALAGGNLNVVAGQGLITFQTLGAAKK